MLQEIRSRFNDSNKDLFLATTALDPRSSFLMDYDKIATMANQYKVETEYLDVELKQSKRLTFKKICSGHELQNIQLSTFLFPYKDAFPDLCKLIHIAE